MQSRQERREDADDLISKVFHRFLERLDAYDRRRGSVLARVLTIAHHALVDHYRAQRPALPVESLAAVLSGSGPSPLDDVLQRERHRRVHRLLAALPDETRQMLSLRFEQELRYREIAAFMGLSEAAVKQRFSRALPAAIVAHRRPRRAARGWIVTARELVEILSSLYRDQPTSSTGLTSRLEADLLLQHERLYGDRQASRRVAFALRPATLLATVLVALICVGALPASYPVAVGSLLTISWPSGETELPELAELLDVLEAAAVATDVSVSISQRYGEEARMALILFDSRRSEDEVVGLLSSRFPTLANARFAGEALVGSVPASLADKIGRALLTIEVSHADREQANRQIIERLAAAGRTARVDVRREGKERRIDIDFGDAR